MRAAFAALALAAGATGPAAAEPFKIVALGDMPYSMPEDDARFGRLIERINAEVPVFSVHIGDIKSGGTPCTDAAFENVKKHFEAFAQPLVYTPGDNEWTDCHRAKAGGFDPLERLTRLRAMFFEGRTSFGGGRLEIKRQDAGADYPELIENFRWQHDGVIFATLHVVGSNNGLERNEAMIGEHFRRDAANLAWIEEAFAEANAADAPAVVIFTHAEMYFSVPDEYAYAEAGYTATLQALSEGAAAFAKPVLIVHGDSHEFVLDQPLLDAEAEEILDNVWRLEVMGADDVQAVEIGIDPEDPGVFAFRPLIVPENLKELAGR